MNVSHVEKSALRQYMRQIAFLCCRHHTIEALELVLNTAQYDSDISPDGLELLHALADGVSDFIDLKRSL